MAQLKNFLVYQGPILCPSLFLPYINDLHYEIMCDVCDLRYVILEEIIAKTRKKMILTTKNVNVGKYFSIASP